MFLFLLTFFLLFIMLLLLFSSCTSSYIYAATITHDFLIRVHENAIFSYVRAQSMQWICVCGIENDFELQSCLNPFKFLQEFDASFVDHEMSIMSHFSFWLENSFILNGLSCFAQLCKVCRWLIIHKFLSIKFHIHVNLQN